MHEKSYEYDKFDCKFQHLADTNLASFSALRAQHNSDFQCISTFFNKKTRSYSKNEAGSLLELHTETSISS